MAVFKRKIYNKVELFNVLITIPSLAGNSAPIGNTTDDFNVSVPFSILRSGSFGIKSAKQQSTEITRKLYSMFDFF